MNNRNVLGFCNLHTSPRIEGLNDKRALGAVTFLGRYAIMDFTLSNFANSGIDGVCILVHHYPHSVLGHVGSGGAWTANTKSGYEQIFFNEFGVATPEYNTDINNILANKTALRQLKHAVEYVVIAPAHYMCCMDFNPIIEQHIAKGSKITCAYVPIHDGKKTFLNSTIIDIDEQGKVINAGTNIGKEKEINVMLDTFVISADVFDDMLRRAGSINPAFEIKDMIYHMATNENVVVDTYRYEHKVIPVLSFDDYYNNSFALLSYENRRKIFREDWPIYTRTHDTPPAHYGEDCDVKDAIISNGCIIDGTVEHSILSRNVKVEKGAVVKNCILFTKTEVKAGVHLENVLSDKSVVITKKVKGKKGEPIYLKQGFEK